MAVLGYGVILILGRLLTLEQLGWLVMIRTLVMLCAEFAACGSNLHGSGREGEAACRKKIAPIVAGISLLSLAIFVSMESVACYFVMERTARLLCPVQNLATVSFTVRGRDFLTTDDVASLRSTLITNMRRSSVVALGLLVLMIIVGPSLLAFLRMDVTVIYPSLLILLFGRIVWATTAPAKTVLALAGHRYLLHRLDVLFGLAAAAVIPGACLLFGLPGLVISLAVLCCGHAITIYACCRELLGIGHISANGRVPG